MSEIIYKCPFAGKIILTVDSISTLRYIGNMTPCPYCHTSHPLAICPREILEDKRDERMG